MYRYNFHMDEKDLKRLKSIAYLKRCTVSEVIRTAISEHIQRHAKRSESPPARNAAARQ